DRIPRHPGRPAGRSAPATPSFQKLAFAYERLLVTGICPHGACTWRHSGLHFAATNGRCFVTPAKPVTCAAYHALLLAFALAALRFALPALSLQAQSLAAQSN